MLSNSTRRFTIFVIAAALAFVASLLVSCGRSTHSSGTNYAPPSRTETPSPNERSVEHPTAPRATEDSSQDTESESPRMVAGEHKTDAQSQVAPPLLSTPRATSSPIDDIGVELKRGSAGENRIALTFDAGASAAPTPALLDVLKKNGLRATFFLTGRWVAQNPRLTRRIAAEGHEIGNHTYSHSDLRTQSDDDIKDQLARTEAIVQETADVSTKPLFRPPFGGRDARVIEVAAAEGYRCVYWSADSWDAFKKGIKSDEIRDRVLDRATDGSIVLMHCGSWPTVEALPDIISELKARGYELVTVGELVR